MNPNDAKTFRRLISKYGRDEIADELNRSKSLEPASLTIVANAGLHPVPNEWIVGELFVASEGNLDFSSISSVEREIESILIQLRNKLVEKNWNKIVLIPFGHSIISMYIKMAVYRTLRIETSDLFYFGEGEYGLLDVDSRKLMLER